MTWQRAIYRPITAPVFRAVLHKSAEVADRGTRVLDLKAVPWKLPGQNVIRAAADAAASTARASGQGIRPLREAIAGRIERVNGRSIDPDAELVITSGSMHGLWLVMLGLLQPGDEVLMTSPGFIADRLIRLTGAVPTFAEVRESEGWKVDIERLDAMVTERTKAFYFCNPDNPTGAVATSDELVAILEFCERHDLFCILDEVFDAQVFDGLHHVSGLSFSDWKDRTIVVQSFTKSYAMPAWRLGNVIAPAGLIAQLTQILQWTMLDLPYITQAAGLAAVTGPQDWVREIGPDFQGNRDRMLTALADVQGISHVVPHGGAFFFVNVEGLGVTAQALERYLLQFHGIPVHPGYNYHVKRGQYVRLAFGATKDDLDECIRLLPKALREVRHAPNGAPATTVAAART